MVDSKDTSNFKIFFTQVALSFLLYLDSGVAIPTKAEISGRDPRFLGDDDLDRLADCAIVKPRRTQANRLVRIFLLEAHRRLT